MKVAVLSDTHFGDDNSALEGGAQSEAYQKLKKAIENYTGKDQPLDYLVLAGDILDFSVASFEKACKKAKPFFQAVQRDKLTRHIVYIPGNHDKHVWDAVEWEVNVIRRMKKHRNPRPFKRTQPACIDMVKGEFLLPGIDQDKDKERWGTLFLEGLFEGFEEEKDKRTKEERREKNIIPIFFAYPNLYIKSKSGDYLVTHGHMLEKAWVLLSELFTSIYPDPSLETLHRLEALNVPLTSMICTGVGQADELSQTLYGLLENAKEGKTGCAKGFFRRLAVAIGEVLDIPWYKRPLIFMHVCYAMRTFNNYMRDRGSALTARYDAKFVGREDVKQRFLTFYRASCLQACETLAMAPLQGMIFGHTHEPLSAASPFSIGRDRLSSLPVDKVQLFNTGGWLRNEKGRSPLVFFLDDQGALTSESIPLPPPAK